MTRAICDPGNGRRCPNNAQRASRGMCKKHYRAWLAANPPVDPKIVAAHIARLRDAGIGWRRMSTASGVAMSTLREIAHGKTTYCFAPTAEAILRVWPQDVAPYQLQPVGIGRRLRGLQALGYTDTVLADRIGTTQGRIWGYLTGDTPSFATPELFAKVDAVFRQLAALPAPTGWTAERARRRSARRGWLPPLAWDEETIDDPAAEPLVDAIRKPTTSGYTVAEDFVEEYEELRDELGLNDWRIAERLGVSYDALVHRLRRRGITPQNYDAEVAS